MPVTTPIKILWEPINEQQDKFVSSMATRCLFSGAFGAGKSLALCAKSLKLSLDYPGNFGYVCRKVRATIGLSTLKTFLDLVCPQELIKDYNKSDGLVTLTNGSQLLFGGLDDYLKLGSLGAGGIGFAAIDEAIETNEDDWRMLEGRLRLPNVPHLIFAATNPGPPTHYLYRMFFTDKKGEVYQASSFDNPALPADYLVRLGEFEGIYRDRYVLGLWKGLEGLVYSSFNDACLIPRFEIDKRWLVYVGHDFGMANPAALFTAENPGTGDFYHFAEYLPGATGRSIYDHVQEFKKITAGYNVVKRAGGNHTTEGETRQGYTAQGWPIMEPKYSQTPKYQIQKVQGMHRLNKIYVFNDLKEYQREKFSFAYEKKDGVLTEQIAHEERYHLMSAERGIMSDFTPETITKTSNTIKIIQFK
jgi:PBSX family phage terminase large subunit